MERWNFIWFQIRSFRAFIQWPWTPISSIFEVLTWHLLYKTVVDVDVDTAFSRKLDFKIIFKLTAAEQANVTISNGRICSRNVFDLICPSVYWWIKLAQTLPISKVTFCIFDIEIQSFKLCRNYPIDISNGRFYLFRIFRCVFLLLWNCRK